MLNYLRQIAIFAKTVEHGSFRRAAEELRLSPSVVSHHISMLEQHLDVALLYRSTRKLSLTSEGEQLLASAQMLVNGAENFIGIASNQDLRLIGQLDITLPAVLAKSSLVDRISQFGIANPSVLIRLDFTDTPRDIIKEGIDVAIRMGWPKDSAFKSRKLSVYERIVVASHTVVAKQSKPTSPNDLLHWHWLALSSVGTHHTFYNQQGQQVTINMHPQFLVNSAYAMLQLVLNGNGVAALPKFLIQEHIDRGELVPVLADWHIKPIETYALWSGNVPKTSLSKRFIDYLAQNTM